MVLRKEKMDRRVFKHITAAFAACILSIVVCPAGVYAGAHKWNTAEEDRGPGIGLNEKNEIKKAMSSQVPEAPEEWVTVTNEPQVIDVFNGVQSICRPGGREDYDPVYNCTALVTKYYKKVYGMDVWYLYQYLTPNAEGIGDFHVPDTPLPGDIGYQTNDEGGPHWFILKRVNADGSFTVFEQNFKGVVDGETLTSLNRKVSYEKTRDLKFFRRP